MAQIRSVFLLCSLIAFGSVGISRTNADANPNAALNALIVGGGPNLSHNQVAIESNVRYFARLLPPGTSTQILFADGDPQTKDVLYLDKDGKNQFRAPQLPAIDGPTLLPEFDAHLKSLTQTLPSHSCSTSQVMAAPMVRLTITIATICGMAMN